VRGVIDVDVEADGARTLRVTSNRNFGSTYRGSVMLFLPHSFILLPYWYC
jgi:hypothetical protein